jgi:serine/threonine-protein kinase
MSGVESGDSIGPELGKKFVVRRVIGTGGMGVVYEVEHVITKRLGALKLLHAPLAAQPRVVERFLREASAAGRIGNPHIVETLDAGTLPNGEPYMFMELLHGVSVRDLIATRGRLRFAEAREIVLQAAEGLAAAHASNIVHRDVKPENLFLCRGNPAYVKIVDFGISKFDVHGDHRLTAEGAPLGTPYYMSPEQVTGMRDVDVRSDVYSLGAVLYECVTGVVPFDAPTLPALSIKILEGVYAPPSRIGADIPAGLDEVIARAMAVEPSRRFSGMGEFHDALARLGSEAPTSLSRTLEGEKPAGEPAERVEPRRTEDATPSGGTIQVASPRRRLYLGLAGASVVVASAIVLRVSALDGDVEHADTTPAEASVSPTPPTASAPAPVPASIQSKPNVPPAVSSAGQLPPAPVRVPSSVQSSATRAARDGLSEENPFEK